MLCYRCGSHVPDGTEACGTCGQKFALGLKPGPIAGFGTGTRRHRIAVETSPYKVGDVLAGRFEIKDNVGAGPIGWVFKCLDREIDVDVSLKVVSPRLLQAADERKALVRELRAVRKLSHPNIVRVYEEGEDGERLFFTMQHLEGLTLRRIWDLRRQKGQVFALREVEPILQQIAQALDYAHGQLAHGDLKPDNIIILPDLLKLTDFGLANALPRAPFMAAQKTGGVHRYLAPEFLHGERIDPRVDVFSLGAILGEMLGGAPFEAGFDLTARNPAVPPAVDEVFRQAVAFEPEKRFRTAGELAEAFGEAAGLRAPKPRAAPARAPEAPPPPPAMATSTPTPARGVVKPPAPAAPAPQAPKAPTPARAAPSTNPAVRELTEEIGEDQIEELGLDAPSLRLPKAEAEVRVAVKTPEPRAAESKAAESKAAESKVAGSKAAESKASDAGAAPERGVAISEMETPKQVTPVKAPSRETAPPPKADRNEKRPEKQGRQDKQQDRQDKQDKAAKQDKADRRDANAKAAPAADKAPSRPAVKVPDAKSEPAWSGGNASVPPPPKQPAPAAPPPASTDRNAKIAAAVLVVIIGLVSVLMVVRDNANRRAAVDSTRTDEASRPTDTAPDAAALAEATDAGVADPAEAAAPEKADANDAGRLAANEDKGAKSEKPGKIEQIEKIEKSEKIEKTDKPARDDRLAREDAAAADRTARNEARRRADEEERLRRERQAEALARLAAEKEAAEKAAAEKAAAEKAASERAAAEKAASEKAAAEKAAAEKAAAEKAAAEKAADKGAGKEDTVVAASVGKSCPPGMRFIPGGSFKFGAPDSDDLKNFGDIDIQEAETAPYCIDIYEAPNRAKVKPTTGVTFKQASDACRAQKKRLCGEEEWERACKGPGNARYPYGKNFDAEACNTEDAEGTARDAVFAGAFSKCVSGYGVYDMAGNVGEWTNSVYEDGGSERAAKGGAADRPDFATRCAARAKKAPTSKERLLGYRCCADPK